MVQLRVEFQSYRFFSTVGITVSSRFRIDFYGFFMQAVRLISLLLYLGHFLDRLHRKRNHGHCSKLPLDSFDHNKLLCCILDTCRRQFAHIRYWNIFEPMKILVQHYQKTSSWKQGQNWFWDSFRQAKDYGTDSGVFDRIWILGQVLPKPRSDWKQTYPKLKIGPKNSNRSQNPNGLGQILNSGSFGFWERFKFLGQILIVEQVCFGSDFGFGRYLQRFWSRFW